MKFINYLESISGVSIFPMISLFIFVVFFAILLYFVFSTDKGKIEEMERIPLDEK